MLWKWHRRHPWRCIFWACSVVLTPEQLNGDMNRTIKLKMLHLYLSASRCPSLMRSLTELSLHLDHQPLLSLRSVSCPARTTELGANPGRGQLRSVEKGRPMTDVVLCLSGHGDVELECRAPPFCSSSTLQFTNNSFFYYLPIK